MKKQLMLIASAAVLCATMIGCGPSNNDPKEVATAFMQAFAVETNAEKALSYCDDAATEFKGGLTEMVEFVKENCKDVSIEFVGADKDTNLADENITQATLIFKCTATKEGERGSNDMSVQLKKIDGKWKVYATK